MIKRLKRKYIFIVMASVTMVLGIIITAINITSYSSLNSQLNDKLVLIVKNEGKMPDFPPPEDTEEDKAEDSENSSDTNEGEGTVEEEEEEDMRQHMSPETPFETRYFTVKFDTGGTVLAVDTSKIAAIDKDKAEKYATEIYAEGKQSGLIEPYKYMRGYTEKGEIIYVFLDATRELESVRSFLVSSLIISGSGIVLIFILIMLLSDVALKPIIESYEKQKRFITDAGHEMKTPLTVISANAEIIEMESGDNQWVTGIKSQVAKLASLTEKLVLLSKMEEGVKLDMDEFSLSEASFDTCDQYRSIAMSKNIGFEIDISDGVTVVGNEVEIRRCISLLLDNAFRYANENGWVKISVKKNSGDVEIKISNSTDGVEKGSLDRWFDRFYRTDLSRNSDTGGSGIGLSVVKAIVHAHAGTVRAYSVDGVEVELTINI